MSMPKGAIWQDLRALALDAIPVGAHMGYSAPLTLLEWQQSGSYVVTAGTQSHYSIVASGIDFGTALLGDAEYLLDHAAEHRVSTWKAVSDTQWLSPAWLVVTFYYWSFFLVLAVTRLTGKSPWFIDKALNKNLVRLLPSGVQHPGSGSFRIDCMPFLSLNDREIQLRRTNTRIHEDLWRTWFTWCSSEVDMYQTGTGSQLEQRLFSAMVLSARRLGMEWPSALRSAVNYRPGLAYDAVRRQQVLGNFSYLRPAEPQEVERLIDRFETNVLGLTSNSLNSQLKTAGRCLIDLTLIMHGIATDLHEDLVERNGLDKRWMGSRQSFVKERGLGSRKAGIWPF